MTVFYNYPKQNKNTIRLVEITGLEAVAPEKVHFSLQEGF
jgi:hypothetical protein